MKLWRLAFAVLAMALLAGCGGLHPQSSEDAAGNGRISFDLNAGTVFVPDPASSGTEEGGSRVLHIWQVHYDGAMVPEPPPHRVGTITLLPGVHTYSLGDLHLPRIQPASGVFALVAGGDRPEHLWTPSEAGLRSEAVLTPAGSEEAKIIAWGSFEGGNLFHFTFFQNKASPPQVWTFQSSHPEILAAPLAGAEPLTFGHWVLPLGEVTEPTTIELTATSPAITTSATFVVVPGQSFDAQHLRDQTSGGGSVYGIKPDVGGVFRMQLNIRRIYPDGGPGEIFVDLSDDTLVLARPVRNLRFERQPNGQMVASGSFTDAYGSGTFFGRFSSLARRQIGYVEMTYNSGPWSGTRRWISMADSG